MPLTPFVVGFSADFLDDSGAPTFPDLGIEALTNQKGLEHRFLCEYQPEYATGQLRGVDVLISLKPRVSRASLESVDCPAAIGRCEVSYDNADLAACTERDAAVCISVAAGFLPASPEASAHWISKGFRIISMGSDIGIYVNGLRQFRRVALFTESEVEK
jgi:hypothetical protein